MLDVYTIIKGNFATSNYPAIAIFFKQNYQEKLMLRQSLIYFSKQFSHKCEYHQYHNCKTAELTSNDSSGLYVFSKLLNGKMQCT